MRSAAGLRGPFIALVVFAAAGIAAAEDVTTLPLGAPAPELGLPGVDGKTYRLKDFADAELLLVVFTCNHCPTAQAYEERVVQLHRDYKDKGVALVAISPNDPLAVRLDELGYSDIGDSFEDMKQHAARRKFCVPVSVRRRVAAGLEGVRRPRYAARVPVRSAAEAPLQRPHRRQRRQAAHFS